MNVSIGDIVSVLALLFSGYATWNSRKSKKKEEEILDLQSKVNLLVLEKEQREASQANSADISANLVRLGKGQHRLKIFNKGKSSAYKVDIDFPDGNDMFIDDEIREKFPMELMEPGQSVELLAFIHFRSKRKVPISLKWKNSDDETKEKVVHVTL